VADESRQGPAALVGDRMSTVRALAFSFTERYFLSLLALVSSMLLARLLSPAEIGTYSVTLAFLAVAQMLRDFGVSSYLIQEAQLTVDRVRSSFGVSLMVGTSLFVLIFLCAPWVAHWYGVPAMLGIMRVVAVNFLILPFSTISMALLRREMRFKRLMAINLMSGVIVFLITMALVLSGMGPISMAIASVCGNIASGTAAWIARADFKVLAPSLTEWRRVTGFGGRVALTNIVTSLSMNANELVLAKVMGVAPVAILSRAQGLIALITRDIFGSAINVIYPAIARAKRDGHDVGSIHARAVGISTALVWPTVGMMSLFPLEIIRLMFGPQWNESAILLPPLALGAVGYAMSCFAMPLLTASGNVRVATRFELIYQPLRAAAVVSTALVSHSLHSVAWAMGIAFALHAPLALFVQRKAMPAKGASLGNALFKSLQVAALVLAGPLAVSLSLGLGRSSPQPYVLIGMSCLVLLIWPLAIWLVHHPISAEPIYAKLLAKLPGMSRLHHVRSD
jgi:lipopolysaccharide exporter